MICSSVNEMCMAIAGASSISTNNNMGRERKDSGLRAISVPLDEPTFSPSPEKSVISRTIGHTRKYIELLFLTLFNKI